MEVSYQALMQAETGTRSINYQKAELKMRKRNKMKNSFLLKMDHIYVYTHKYSPTETLQHSLKRTAVTFYLFQSLLLRAKDRMAFSSCGSLCLTKHFCVSLSVWTTKPLHIKHFYVKLAIMTKLYFLKRMMKRFSENRARILIFRQTWIQYKLIDKLYLLKIKWWWPFLYQFFWQENRDILQ